MYEPQSARPHDMASGTASSGAAHGATESSSDGLRERFEQGRDMRELYEQMRPDQRTAIAGEFIRMLTLAGDDQVEQFRQHFQRQTQIAEPSKEHNEELLSAEQVARLDAYVRQRHPDLIAQVMEHPVTESALASPGAQAVDEQDAPANVDKVMPTENVATSGAAYATGWEMMELGGERANQLAEDPHEQAVMPEGEREARQRAVENEGEEGERPSTETDERSQ